MSFHLGVALERPASQTLGVDVARDQQERKLFRLARAANLPMIGICRGAQFLCVMAGGRLCQHLDGHRLGRDQNHGFRALELNGAVRDLECSSTHHQMQLPPPGAEVLAWAEPRLAGGRYLNGDDQLIAPAAEYEAVYYPQDRSLGFQWHPEWMSPDHPCVAYTRRVTADRLGLCVKLAGAMQPKYGLGHNGTGINNLHPTSCGRQS